MHVSTEWEIICTLSVVGIGLGFVVLAGAARRAARLRDQLSKSLFVQRIR
jgi:hypothetical protein